MEETLLETKPPVKHRPRISSSAACVFFEEAEMTWSPMTHSESNAFEADADYPLLYWGHLVLAVGYIWTFQSVILAQSYYAEVYPDSHLNTSVMVATTWPLALMHLFQMLSGAPDFLGVSPRILFGFLGSAVSGIMFIMQDSTNLLGQGAALHILMLAAAVGQMQTFIEGPLYCTAGLLPKRTLSQAVQAGNGGAGVLVWAVQVLIRLLVSGTGGETLRGTHYQFRVFFCVQVAVCLVCMAVFWRMSGTAAFSRYVTTHTDAVRVESQRESYFKSRQQACERYLSALRAVWLPALCQFVILGTSLSMWPAIPGLACTGGSFKIGGLFEGWYMDIVLGAYNVGDFAGKTALPLLRWTADHVSDSSMLGLVIGRSCVLVPLILSSSAPQLYDAALANWVSLVVVFILGFSNGFLSTLAMMVAPKRVPKHLAEDAANLMVLSMFFGISSGATLSYGLTTALPIGVCAESESFL